MRDKMVRFLTSLGLSDPSRFDMDFELVGRDAANPKKVDMTIRKSQGWEYSLLDEFQSALSTVRYDYELRFSYTNPPDFESLDQLFADWYLSHYHGLPPFQLTPSDDDKVLVHLEETASRSTTDAIIADFNAMLKWLSYPYVVSLSEDNVSTKDAAIAPAPTEETPLNETPAVTPTVEAEETNESSCSDDEEKDDSGEKEPPMSDEAIDEEASRQSALQEAERAYLANQKAHEDAQASRQIFRRGDYQEHAHISELFEGLNGNVQFEGEIYECNFRIGRGGGLYGSLGVGDSDSAINVRAMENKLAMSAQFLNSLKPGMHVKVRGALENDRRTNERQVFAHYLDLLPNPPLRGDPETEKRVELHLHTKMSVMDGLGDIERYCAVAKNMGMSALAVTDHGVIQAFPAAESAAKKCGLKMIYGCEFYMFDFPKYVFNPAPIPLRKARYCVFDFETTGLSSRYDHPTEFGGVIVENGMLSKRLDQFIDPGVHIPEKITQKTHIDDSMVKGAPSEIEAAKILSDFIGDCVLVSHNAPFDVGFLNEMRRKAGMPPITNPVIDTLALSHYLFPEAGRHTLGALSRNLNLEVYDEDSAHRADYDAEALNNVWQTIIPLLTKENADLTQADLLNLVCTNPNIYKHLKSYHMVALAKNQAGLKQLYRLVSDSHVTYMAEGSLPKIPREELVRYRDNLIYGSACFNGEIFEIASNKSQGELENAMRFYDYIEVQPLENYSWLVNMGEYDNARLLQILHNLIDTSAQLGKPVCATGDCHYVDPEDKICRDIYISAKALGGGNHPLNPARRDKMGTSFPNPDQHFRSTAEMLASFRTWLPEDKCREIVVKNTQAIAALIEPITILKDKLYPPSANLPNSDVKIKEIIYENVRKKYGEHPDPLILERLEQELKGIIENGYSVTYYIAHCIIKQSNEDGYLVGSRGSVGSSFAATMSGITEVNPLPPHYLCPKCHHLEWSKDPEIKSGFDLPEKKCPECGETMVGDGQNIPFQTFLGFNAEKVPDIDLNFPADYQSKAHAYARTLLSTKEENEKIARGENITNPHVIRAGTIATAEEKNAFGYVKGYYERIVHKDWATVNKAWAAFLATRCTGVKRTTGQHPGGIVVIPADMDIFDFTPYQHPADDPNADWLTTHYEFASMHDSCLKLDLLGHVDPMALRMMSLLTNIDIRTIPMNDPAVLSLFHSPKSLKMKTNPLGFTTGAIALPEFGTDLAQRMLNESHPQNFNDLLIISGLAHGTDVWNNNAEDLIMSKTATLQQVIGCRDDIMNDLIGYGIDNSTSFAIMEKVRHGKGLTPDWEKLMKEHQVPDYFIASCKKIHYLFPRAHATAYVMGAVRVAWFKVHYPLEFYATYFTVRCDKFDVKTMCSPLPVILEKVADLRHQELDKLNPISDKDEEILKTLIAASEMVDRGFKIENIDLMRSQAADWVVDKANNGIIAPFSVISGLGAAAAQTVVEARKDGDFISIEDLSERTKLSQSDIAALKELGVLDGMGETNQMTLF